MANSNPYVNPYRMHLASNVPSGAQIQFVQGNPPPSYSLPAQGVVPGQPIVQHVVVPVAVPVRPGEQGQFGQPMPVYSMAGISNSPTEKSKRKSEELNYYLGSEKKSKRSRRSRSRSRSRDRYSDDWEMSERARSRNSDNNHRGNVSRSDQDYSRVSRSPEGSRHSRHSYRKAESRHPDRHDRQTESRHSDRHDRQTESRHSDRHDRETESRHLDRPDRQTESRHPDRHDRQTESRHLDRHDRQTESSYSDRHDRQTESRHSESHSRQAESRHPDRHDRQTESRHSDKYDRQSESRYSESHDRESRHAETYDRQTESRYSESHGRQAESRYSESHDRQAESRYSDRHHESKKDYDLSESRNRYKTSGDSYGRERESTQRYNESEYANRDNRKNEDGSERYTGRSDYEEDNNKRSYDRYSGYDSDEEARLRKRWNDDKNELGGKSRKHDYERNDYAEAKRRKYAAEYEREEPLGRGESSAYGREDYRARDSDRDSPTGYERELRDYREQRSRENVHKNTDVSDKDYDRQYDRDYEQGDDYDRRQPGYDRRSKEYPDSDRPDNELKVHVDDRGRWIETNKHRGESDKDRSRRSDGYDSESLNITIENEKAYDNDERYDSRREDTRETHERDSYRHDKASRTDERRDYRESSRYDRQSDRYSDTRSDREQANVRVDRPKLYEDEREVATSDRPKLYEDEREVGTSDRPKLYEDEREVGTSDRPKLYEDEHEVGSSNRPKLYEDEREVGSSNRPKLYEDEHELSKRYSERDSSQRRSSEYPSQSYSARSHRSDYDNVSESGSVGRSSNRSSQYPARHRSPVPHNDRPDYDRFPPHHHTSTAASDNVRRMPKKFVTRAESEIPFEVPVLCLNHTSKLGCLDPKCPNWHVCRYLIKGNCRKGAHCTKGHDFFSGQIYHALYELNDRKINFRELNHTHIMYKIVGKLRQQLNDLFAVKGRNDSRPETNEKIDPEFDASNYDEAGQFIKKSDNKNEKSDKANSSDKPAECEEGKSEAVSKDDKSESKSSDLKEDSKTDEKSQTDKGSTDDEKKQDTDKDKSESTKENEKDSKKESVGSDTKKEKEKDQDSKVNSNSDDKKENEKDGCGSLSPVSVEIIDNWEEYERYESVSEDEGLSDVEDKKDELENISSDEEVPKEKDEFPLNEHNILAKAAVPIGMNDPLVFNPSKNAPPNAAQAAPKPVGVNEPLVFNPIRNPQPNVHMGANMPLPMQMNAPLAFNPLRNPPPMQVPVQTLPVPVQSHPLFPAAQAMGGRMPNMNRPPPPLPTPLAQLPQQFNVPPPPVPATVNYLPSPSILQEVIQSLQSKEVEKPPPKTVPKRKSGDVLESLVEKHPELNEVIQTPWQFPHKGMLNMSVIDFVTETEAYKEEFVAELMRILVTLDLPYVTMKKLLSVIKEKMQMNIKSPVDMRKILSMYPDCFQVIETLDSDDEDDDPETVRRNVQIKAKPSLGFCDRHGYLPFATGKCDCNALHICRFFFLSHCPQQKCKFGHKLKTNHNMTVFRSHKLHRMTCKEVMTFVRDLDNRHVEMVPEVCRFYNREKGNCYKADLVEADIICHKLHLCLFFAKGNCYRNPCRRSHDIRDKQPLALLRLYGIDPNVVGDERIVQMLREVMTEMEKKKTNRNAPNQGNKKGGSDQMGGKGGIEDSGTDLQQAQGDKGQNNQSQTSSIKVKPKVRKVNVKLPHVCKFYNNELGCKKRDWGASGYCMFIHVCQHFVTGDCKFGDKCKRSHDLVTGPAGQLLQKHGLDTTQFTSRELGDVLNYPEEAYSTEKNPPKKVVVMPAKVDNVAKASEAEVKAEVKSKQPVINAAPAPYKSYSVEAILEQIIERGKEEEERKQAEQE